MAPVGQYVFAEMLGISEHFTAGSHKWLPYSVIPTLFKTDLQTTFCLQFGGECVWAMPETGGVSGPRTGRAFFRKPLVNRRFLCYNQNI